MLETTDTIIEYENTLLGIMSNYLDTLDLINFKKEFFLLPFHQKVYQYLISEKTMNVELMQKYMSLEESKDFVTKIYNMNCFSVNSKDELALSYANLILENWKHRAIDELDRKRNQEKVVDYYEELLEIKSFSCEQQVEEMTNDLIDEMISEDEEVIYINNFSKLSNCLKLNTTDLVTVAGTSGFGKSAFLLNIYKNLSQSGKFKCHYFNLEVAPKMMIKRLLAITANCKVDEINKSSLNKDYYINARNKINDNDSYISSGSSTIEEIKSKVLMALDDEKINVVFVDHIGLLETNNSNYSGKEYDRVTYCMKELRNLALDYNLIVFVASQFDRQSIKSGNIGMSSLKSSGEIENSSTHVLLLKESKTRPTQEIDKKNYQEITIDVAKNRNGEKRELDFYTFLKTKQIFMEV